MSLSERLINLHCFCRGSLRCRQYLFGRSIARKGKTSTSINQSDIGQRVAGVGLDRLLEKTDALCDVGRSDFAQMITSRQIKPIGRGVLGVALGETLLLFTTKSQR